MAEPPPLLRAPPKMSESKGLDGWVELAAGILAAVFVLIVAGSVAEGEIEDALVEAARVFLGAAGLQ